LLGARGIPMLELLLLLTLGGLTLASHRRMGLANPFQIYFLIWLLVFFGYYFYATSFIKLQSEFLVLMLITKSIAILFLIVILINTTTKNQVISNNSVNIKNRSLLDIAQILVLLIIPLVYKKALSLSNGVDIFSVLGYVQLRAAMTEDGQGFGFLNYFYVLSYVLSSISVILYINKKIGVLRLSASIAISLFYVYIGTGRTGALLLLLLIFIPLVLLKIFRLKGIFIFSLLVIILFVFIAGMTAKGVSVESGTLENIESFLENIRGYTVAPILAFSKFIDLNNSVGFGENIFRTFFAIFYSLGMTDIPPIALIRDYTYVPDATNVYTVYEVYFRDFSYFGIFIPPLFLLFHWWLYRKALQKGGIWIFYYAASSYPLMMQFFQDQYFSLLSSWVQIGFWYWFFFYMPKISFPRIKFFHA
jgi:oligosaccharide repeat unit polymerase